MSNSTKDTKNKNIKDMLSMGPIDKKWFIQTLKRWESDSDFVLKDSTYSHMTSLALHLVQSSCMCLQCDACPVGGLYIPKNMVDEINMTCGSLFLRRILFALEKKKEKTCNFDILNPEKVNLLEKILDHYNSYFITWGVSDKIKMVI